MKKLLSIGVMLFLIAGGAAWSAEFEVVDQLTVNGLTGMGTAGPQAKLHLIGNTVAPVLIASHTIGGYGLVVSSYGSVGIKLSLPNKNYALDVGGGINGTNFYRNGNLFAQWKVCSPNPDIYYTDGAVGIGPAFDVDSTLSSLLELRTDDSSGTQFELRNTSAGGGRWKLYSTGSGNTEGAGKFMIYNEGGGVRMMIDTDGNVGISTATPVGLLHVGDKKLVVLGTGNVGIGTTGPVANLQIKAANPTLRLSTTGLNTGNDSLEFS
ncbi:hypothetical protein KJ633_06655, partial [bacterium]|nr:hypothetical protein [bacterium]